MGRRNSSYETNKLRIHSRKNREEREKLIDEGIERLRREDRLWKETYRRQGKNRDRV